MDKFKINKVLFPTDFSETANIALKQAIFLAKTAKAKLHILHVLFPDMNFEGNAPVPHGKSYNDNLKSNVERILKKISNKIIKENSIDVSYEVKFGVVSEQICSVVEDDNIDIIVMGTHGASGVTEFFSGSNASKVSSRSNCQVITIQKELDENGFRKIILPISLETHSRQKVDYVIELAKLFSSTVFIVGFTDEKDKLTQTKVKQYVKQVEKYLLKMKIKYNSSTIFKDNFVKEIILFAKNNNADLIATMSENDFSVDHLIKGSYSKQLVNHSDIPVLTVPVFSDPDLYSYSPYLSGAVFE